MISIYLGVFCAMFGWIIPCISREKDVEKTSRHFFNVFFFNTCASVTLESNKDYVWKLRRDKHWDYFKMALKIFNTNCAIRSLELQSQSKRTSCENRGNELQSKRMSCICDPWIEQRFPMKAPRGYAWRCFKRALNIVNTNFAIRSIELQFVPSSYNRNPRERVV